MRGLALHLTAAVVGVLAVASAAAQERVGVNSAVNPEASGTPPGGTAQRLVIGQPVLFNERIATRATGQSQILFLDESAMTVGPNSDVVIDQFVFDPKTGKGRLAMSMTRGILRFIGGQLSKENNAVTLRTTTATLAVRGGVFLADQAPGGRLDVYFLYGAGLSVTGTDGITQLMRRPGFAISVAAPGAPPSPPYPAPPAVLAALLASLDGRPGGSGGAAHPPSNAAIASSAISADVSGKIAQPLAIGPVPVDVTALQADLQVNTVQSQGTPGIGLLDGNPSLATGATTAPMRTSYPLAAFAAVDTTTIFSGRFRRVVEPATAVLQNGILTAIASNAAASFPLAPGNNNFGPQSTSASFGTVTGTVTGSSFLAPDNAFFYAEGTSPSFPNKIGVVASGIPTVNLPTTGIGSFSGGVTGLVDSNGAIFLASGSFTNVYNFSTNTGNFTISNFDGKTLNASVSAVGPISAHTAATLAAQGIAVPSGIGNLIYKGTLAGSGLKGGVGGAFFGNNALDTGGVFAFRSPSGSFKAGGLFGGRR